MMGLLVIIISSVCAGIAIAAVVVAIAVLASGWLLVRRRLGKRPRISRPILPAIAKPGAAKRQPAQRLPSDAVILSQESHDLLISPLQMPSSTLHGSTSGDPVLLHGVSIITCCLSSPGQAAVAASGQALRFPSAEFGELTACVELSALIRPVCLYNLGRSASTSPRQTGFQAQCWRVFRKQLKRN